MTAPTKSWADILDAQVDADSPVDVTLLTAIRDNLVFLRDWLGGSYALGAIMDHNHDGVNSALVGVPVGSVGFMAMNTAPTGWLKANGAAISRTTYSTLFSVIGTAFGVGDGTTTFNLPDLRGEFPRGWDDGRGADSGRAFASAQSHAYPAHTHSVAASVTAGSGYWRASDRGYDATFPTLTTGSSGSGSETRPRNIALLACIKY